MSNSAVKRTYSPLHSIRTKFAAMMLIFGGALMLIVIGLINKTVGETVLDEGLEKGIAVARGVAAASDDPLLTNDDLTLFTVIKGITENKGVLYGFIVGSDKTIKAHSSIEKSGGEYKEPLEERVFREGRDFKVKTYNSAQAGFVYDISVPITSPRAKSGIGFVHIGMSRRFIDEAVNRVNRYIKYLTIIGLFIGSIGAVALTTIMVRPIKALVKGARALGDGDLDYRIDVKRKDELGVLMSAFNDMADGLKQKQVIQESFGKYVAPEVLDMILKNKEGWFKGKKTNVTILFADIRGFTSFSEKVDPETLIKILNEYFTLMTTIIHKHRGYVDKFIGDAVMVVFGSPVYFDDHALQAARAACEMHEKLRGFNRARPEDGRIEIGIGLNTGEVVAGNLGSVQKMEYAVIGDSVNIASRLCSAAKRGDIIISRSTFDAVKGSEFGYKEMDPITVKGKSEPIGVYSLLPRRSHDRRDDDPDAAAKRRRADSPEGNA